MGKLQTEQYELTEAEREFLEDLYRKKQQKLLDYAILFLDTSNAEEAVQNVFLDACKEKKIKELMKHSEPTKWLYKALQFSISKIIRSKKQCAQLMIYAPPQADAEHGVEMGIEDFPDQRPPEENVDFLYGDLAGHKEFQLIKEFTVEGKSLKDIAKEQGISVRAAEQRLYRARIKLRKLFQDKKT